MLIMDAGRLKFLGKTEDEVKVGDEEIPPTNVDGESWGKEAFSTLSMPKPRGFP